MKKTYKHLAILIAAIFCGVAAQAQTTIFSFTGSPQYYTVPTGKYTLVIDAEGATGGISVGAGPHRGGYGGCVVCTLAVTPGQVFLVTVGGKGNDAYYSGGGSALGGAGGYNDAGANGGNYIVNAGGGGGGASDIRSAPYSTASRILVAGGGGGAGGDYVATDSERGGDGGGTTGEDGYYNYSSPHLHAGGGGGPISGGSPGTFFPSYGSGVAGTSAVGGAGGLPSAGGGGGGGYFGGGGGSWGGGGGGSSYTDPSFTGVTHTRGCNTAGDGLVTINATCIIPLAGTIIGPTNLCLGTSFTYTDPTATVTGTWTSSNPAVATINPVTGALNTITTGTTDISYTVTRPCGSNTATITLNVNTQPGPISGGGNLCQGNPTGLVSSPSGGVWTSANPVIATVGSSTGIVTGMSTGTTDITYSFPGGCFSTTSVNIVGLSGLHQVCVGSTTPLSSSAPGGTWSSSNPSFATVGSSSGIVTGIGMGVATISYSAPGTSCYALWSMSVNPNAPILGRDSVCVGSGTYLTSIVGGGTWTSAFPTIASISPDSGLVYGVSPGVTPITYRLPTGCVSYASVTSIAMPAPITGINHVCPGGTITLANATPGGVWTSNDPSIATVNPGTGVVTGVYADTIGINYTVLPNCTVTENVIVNPLPMPIQGKSPICPGIEDSLTDASPGGSWTTNTPALATIIDSTGVATILTGPGGTAVFVYTLPTGCSISKNITVLPSPIPVITYNFNSQTMYTPDIYEAYQWYDSIQGLIPMAHSPNCAPLFTEYYFVEVTDTLGCKGRSALFHFYVEQLGVSTAAGAKVNVYPNPATSMVMIDAQVRVRAVLTAADGKKVLELNNAKQVDISDLANGAYIISLYDDSGKMIATKKLVKE